MSKLTKEQRFKKRIEKIAFGWELKNSFSDWSREEVVEFVANLALCDCHTWPTLEEVHNYIEALENERREQLNTQKELKE